MPTRLTALLLVLAITRCGLAEDESLAGLPIKEYPARWRTVFGPGPDRVIKRYSEELDLGSACPVEFEGPEGDRNQLGRYKPAASFRITKQGLQSPADATAALHIATAEAFEMEALIEGGDTGAMILLVGWTGEQGWLVHQVCLRQSEFWTLHKFDGEKFAPVKTLPEFRWRSGVRPVRLAVSESKLTLQIGSALLCNQEPVEGYQRGQIIIGSADSLYGPKQLTVGKIRFRSMRR